MLHVIDNMTHPLVHLVSGDPVRPHVTLEDRLHNLNRILVLENSLGVPSSVVCVAFSDHVITDESEIAAYQALNPSVAILYTIWSLDKGGGQAMIPMAKQWIRKEWPTVSQLVTLSPHTAMARRFHEKNGAHELQMNEHTVNFEYDLC
jgi:hypothetical protein